MIPKVIHYCWFGRNPKPKLAEKCIRSWKKYCPDYKIMEWNEDNCDLSGMPKYVQDAYAAGKWAFVTDYIRLQILHTHGGIYFDTDVQVVRRLDPLLKHECFMGIERADNTAKVATGLALGSEAGFPLLREMMEDYLTASFYRKDGTVDITTCTVRNTEILKRYGFVEENRCQEVAGAMIYSSEYFSPMDMNNGKIYRTANTYTIHHYSLSWTPKEHQLSRQKAIRKIRMLDTVYNIKTIPNRFLKKVMGEKGYGNLKKTIRRR